MSIRRKANTGLRLVSTERVFDEQAGVSTLETWEGLKQDVETALAGLLTLTGVRANSRQKEGPWYQLFITWAGANDGGNEPAVDTWGMRTEFAQEDIRSNPIVISLAGSSDTLNEWVKDIKDKINGTLQIEFVAGTAKARLYDLFTRGAEAYETRRVVLRRARVIPVGYAEPQVVSATELVYTTGQLINGAGVPQAFAAKLPAKPAQTPSDTMWGWRVRTADSQFMPSVNKVEEVMEWAFAAWSTLLYTPA